MTESARAETLSREIIFEVLQPTFIRLFLVGSVILFFRPEQECVSAIYGMAALCVER